MTSLRVWLAWAEACSQADFSSWNFLLLHPPAPSCQETDHRVSGERAILRPVGLSRKVERPVSIQTGPPPSIAPLQNRIPQFIFAMRRFTRAHGAHPIARNYTTREHTIVCVYGQPRSHSLKLLEHWPFSATPGGSGSRAAGPWGHRVRITIRTSLVPPPASQLSAPPPRDVPGW